MSRLFKAMFLGLFTGAIGVIVGVLPFGLSLEEDIGLGLLFKLRGQLGAPSDAVIVSIDKQSSEYLDLPDNPDKWPRSVHARLTENLSRAGARVIAFDVHFVEPRSPQEDGRLAEAIGSAHNCLLCEPMKTREIRPSGEGGSAGEVQSVVRVVKPLDLLSRQAVSTAPFPLPRIPFKVNRYWTFQTGAGDVPTLPVVAFQLYAMPVYGDFVRLLEKTCPDQAGRLPHDGNVIIKTGRVKDLAREIREIFESEPSVPKRMLADLDRSAASPGDPKNQVILRSLVRMYQGANSRYLNYYGPPRTVTTVPYYQALRYYEKGAGDGYVDLKGKAVFVGLSEVLLAERKDSFYTVFSQADGLFIGGVEIMATAFLNLLEGAPIEPVGTRAYILIILLWGVFLGIATRIPAIGVAAASTVVLSIAYLGFAAWQFKAAATWYPVVVPLFLEVPVAFFGAVTWKYVDTNKERLNIRKAFEHYLPKEVVDQLARDIAHIQTGSKVVYGVCLYTDAQQYTALSETMEPADLGRFMNRYYGTMFKPVKQHGGFVSGVIGDSMLALWVSARCDPTLKAKACQAVLEIREALQQFETASSETTLKTRLGLHCGTILLGHIGALDHYEYTPMGDIVNTASRIEGLNKHLGTNVLVSGDLVEQLVGFLTREVGTFRLKGKTKPIEVYELRGQLQGADEREVKACALFAEGLAAFKQQSWDDATERFRMCLAVFGEDVPSRMYIGLCGYYKENRPEEPWDGVIHMEKK